MGGLRASELPPETLCAGDVIEYYSRKFVCGDLRGHRIAVVLSIDAAPDNPLPVSLDTGEPLPLTNFMRRLIDSAGKRLDDEEIKWRTLRSYRLVPGAVRRPTRASALCEALSTAVDDAYASTRAILHAESEESPRPSSSQLRAALPEPGCTINRKKGPRTTKLIAKEVSRVAKHDSTHEQSELCEEVIVPAVVDLTDDTDGEEDILADRQEIAGEVPGENGVGEIGPQAMPESAPTDQNIEEAEAYVKAVPTRWMRAKIRHQKKKRPGNWSIPRSRKRRHQLKCGVTRSGFQLYHTHSLKAKKVKALLRIPGVKSRLRNLRARRPAYVEASVDDTHSPAEVSWPDEVTKIVECVNPKAITFKDIGEYDRCECIGDCFMDTCANVLSAVFCTPDSCKLGANCSNAPRARETLKLFDTGRVGLGVFTTTNLDVGDVIGEYAGVLAEYDAIVEGQPIKALKQNSGYTLLCNAKSSRNKFVYVEALNCGFTTRFISHACDANAAFVEMQNRTEVKVLVKMVKDVKAGAQITVNYGPERWFQCTCNDCWTDKTVSDSA